MMRGLKQGLKVCFMGGRQAGVMGLLAVVASGNEVKAAVSYSPQTDVLLGLMGVPVFKSVKAPEFVKALKKSDLLVSVHGREIVRRELLMLPRFGGVNVHPYLYRYKGADPVGRALRDKNYKASVGVHVMTEKVDSGRVLVEEFENIKGVKSPDEAFNRLYSHYASALIIALGKIARRKNNGGKKAFR